MLNNGICKIIYIDRIFFKFKNNKENLFEISTKLFNVYVLINYKKLPKNISRNIIVTEVGITRNIRMEYMEDIWVMWWKWHDDETEDSYFTARGRYLKLKLLIYSVYTLFI